MKRAYHLDAVCAPYCSAVLNDSSVRRFCPAFNPEGGISCGQLQILRLFFRNECNTGFFHTMIEAETVNGFQNSKKRLCHKILLFQPGGQSDGDIRCLDHKGQLLQDTQTGDPVELLAQHTVKSSRKRLIAFDGGEGEQSGFRMKSALTGILGKALKILKSTSETRRDTGAAPLDGIQPAGSFQPGESAAKGAAVQIPHPAHLSLRGKTVICAESVLENVCFNLFLCPFPWAGCVSFHTDHPEIGMTLLYTIRHRQTSEITANL